MSFEPLPPEVLRVGQPTLIALRDRSGLLLVPKGTMVEDEEQLQQLLERNLYVDASDGEAIRRAVAGKVHEMLRHNERLGRIAEVRAGNLDIGARGDEKPRRLDDALTSWSDLQTRMAGVLRDPSAADLTTRLAPLQKTLLAQLDGDPDDALLVLVHGATQDYRDYSANHAVLVAVLVELAARKLAWPAAERLALRNAALTMNIAMTGLQNQLAQQATRLDPAQAEAVRSHAARSADALRAAGIDDALWIDAVRRHHDAPAGPLARLEPGVRLARLIRRADVFAARLSPRKGRPAMSAVAAAKAAFLDENGAPDEAGSALIKATGLYPPGCLVTLASGETAVVLRRGLRANAPIVASVLNPAGAVIALPGLRHTNVAAHAVTGGVAPHEVRLRLNLAKLLRMT